MPRTFETNVDISCESGQELIGAVLVGSVVGPTGTFNGGPILPAGCVLDTEQITFTIDGESFGPFLVLPASVGPLAAGTWAGLSFNLTGTIQNSVIVPASGFEGQISITALYEVTGDICGSAKDEDTISLEWASPGAICQQTDNGLGNFVYDAAPSEVNACPGGIVSYLWEVNDTNGDPLVEGVDYTNNTGNLTSSQLDITYSDVGTYEICLTITTDCGTDRSCKDTVYALADPVAAIPSDETDGNAILFTTVGSVDNGLNIEADPNYQYTDIIEMGPCGATVGLLGTVVALGGGAYTLDFTGSIVPAPNQAAVQAAFVGNMDAAGVVLNKEAVFDELVAGGVINTTLNLPPIFDAIEFCITRSVLQVSSPSRISANVTQELPIYIEPGLYNNPYGATEAANGGIPGIVVADVSNFAVRFLHTNGVVETIYQHGSLVFNVVTDFDRAPVNGYHPIYFWDAGNDGFELTFDGVSTWNATPTIANISRYAGDVFNGIHTQTGSGLFISGPPATGGIKINWHDGAIWNSVDLPFSVARNSFGIAVDNDPASNTYGSIYALGSDAGNESMFRFDLTGPDPTNPADWKEVLMWDNVSGGINEPADASVASYTSALGLVITGLDGNGNPEFLFGNEFQNSIWKVSNNVVAPGATETDYQLEIVAGSTAGTAGDVDGFGTAARIGSPRHARWTGSLYIFMDQDQDKVKSYNPATGEVITLSGDGAGFQDTKHY